MADRDTRPPITDAHDAGYGTKPPATLPAGVDWTGDYDVWLRWREAWEPYVVGAVSPTGEVKVFCPVHEDRTPSGSMNLERGAWQCHGCGESGFFESRSGRELLLEMETEAVPEWVSRNAGGYRDVTVDIGELPELDEVEDWCANLLGPRHPDQAHYLTGKRHIALDILERRCVGWDDERRAYTHPVFDKSGEVIGVKFRAPRKDGKRIWSARGSAGRTLNPWSNLTADGVAEFGQDLWIVEGEIDVLTADTLGLRSISPTGGADQPWDPEWSRMIRQHMATDAPDGRVYILPDFDESGERFAQRVYRSLVNEGLDPALLRLPLEDKPHNKGADLNDILKAVRGDDDRAHEILREAIRRYDAGDMDELVDEAEKAAEEKLERAIESRSRQLWIDEQAKVRVANEMAAAAWEPLEVRDGQWMVDHADDEIAYRIDQLAVAGGNNLIIGEMKAGKTTLILNLIRSLTTGEDFVGFRVTPVADDRTVAFLNFEVSQQQMSVWIAEVGFEPKALSKIRVLNLRGRTLDIGVNFEFGQLASALQQAAVEVLIVDPFARAFIGDENSNTEVKEWTDRVDRLKDEAGVDDVFVVTHSGKDIEKGARGARRLQDWPDSLWSYWSDKDGTRLIKAIGRDVDVPPTKIRFDAKTRRLSRGVATDQPEGVTQVETDVYELYNAMEPGPLEGWEDVARVLVPDATDEDVRDRSGELKQRAEAAWDHAMDMGYRWERGTGPNKWNWHSSGAKLA